MLRYQTTRATVLAGLALLIAVGPRVAWGWGPQGHRVIARVAEDRLTPKARAAIRELLHEGDTLASVSNWADHEGHEAVPASGPWHFINVPITEARFDPREVHGDANVVARIALFRRVLLDRKAPTRDRQRALLFFSHFVADIHQPLHVGDDGDQGGNRTQVQFFNEGTNLHRLWDSDLIHRVGGPDRDWVARVERAIDPTTARTWGKDPVATWADESLQAAKVAYHGLDGQPRRPGAGVVLGEAYFRRAEPIVVDRMARAAVRLAEELNAIFP